jgi:hypothetical protein
MFCASRQRLPRVVPRETPFERVVYPMNELGKLTRDFRRPRLQGGIIC